MKIYTNTFELTERTPRQFKVPPFSDYKIGVKIVNNGAPVASAITLKVAGVTLNPDQDKINGFTLYTMKSGEMGATEFQVYVEGVPAPLKLVQITSNGSVFDIDEVGEGGGGGSVDLSNYYTKAETSSSVEISAALDGKQPVGNYLTAHQSLENYYTKSETLSSSAIYPALAPTGITTVYAADWANISSTADANTFYIVLPDQA